MVDVRRAFTLIELLIAVTIIATLAGLVLTGYNAISAATKRNRSATILEIVRSALELASAERGLSMSPAEHPLAGSAAAPGRPRPPFVRNPSQVGPTGFANRTAYNLTTDPALVGPIPGELAAAFRPRLLMREDVFSDGDVPLLYGLQRSRIGVLGLASDATTRQRRLRRPPAGAPAISNPDDLLLYPDELCLISGSDAQAHGAAIEAALGSAGALAELTRIGGLRSPLPTSTVVLNGRARSVDPVQGSTAPQWKAGMANDAGTWRLYRLPLPAIYDGWGREVLISREENGGIHLESAGRDGVFRIRPSGSGSFASAAEGPIAEPDGNGRLDNIVSGTEDMR